jgi:hypothetical protein
MGTTRNLGIYLVSVNPLTNHPATDSADERR